jgi:hypothetical protein
LGLEDDPPVLEVVAAAVLDQLEVAEPELSVKEKQLPRLLLGLLDLPLPLVVCGGSTLTILQE